MAYKIKDEEECLRLLREAMHTLTYLRHWTDEWHQHYGAQRKALMDYWKQKADDLIQRLDMKYEGSHATPDQITTNN